MPLVALLFVVVCANADVVGQIDNLIKAEVANSGFQVNVFVHGARMENKVSNFIQIGTPILFSAHKLSGRINIGVERAKVLAEALRVHPAIIVFPGWEVGHAS